MFRVRSGDLFPARWGGVDMYLHLGQNVMVRDGDILGIFDLDNTSWSFRTRRFLDRKSVV